VIADTLSYFIKDLNGSVWHLYFTDFGGQSNGMSAFERKMISAASLENSETNSTLTVYPNPAGRLTYLVSDLSRGGEATLDILDMRGRLVRSSTLFLPTGFTATPVPVEDLSQGIYFLKLNTSEGFLNARLFVNR
jgi:hypothetical protein